MKKEEGIGHYLLEPRLYLTVTVTLVGRNSQGKLPGVTALLKTLTLCMTVNTSVI